MSVTETESLSDLLADDRLEDARTLLVAQVKANPGDAELRVSLAQVLAVCGDLERAETHGRMAQQLAPEATMRLGDLRQTLRALHARAEYWAQGAVPDMPLGPSDADRAALALAIALRGDDTAAVDSAKAALEQAQTPLGGTLNGVPFEVLRDLDDRLPHAFEALTTGGHYLWLDFAKVAEVAMAPLVTPLDLVARPARVTLRDGSSADLRLAAVYDAPRDARESLARVTEFSDLPHGLMRAHGQRALLAGDDVVGLHEIEQLTLTHE